MSHNNDPFIDGVEYQPSQEEIEVIARLLHCTPWDIEKFTYRKMADKSDGKTYIFARTPNEDWVALRGRMWAVNIEDETIELYSMN